MSSSVVARTSQPFKWWQSVGILICFGLLVYGAIAAWSFVRVSNELGILKNANAAVRQHAAEALGRSKSSRVVAPLIAALNDPDPGVQGSAAMALGQIQDSRAVQPLMATFKAAVKDGQATKGPDDQYSVTDQQRSRLDVAQKAADALGNLGAPALDGLMAAFKDKDLNGYAAPGLVKMGAPAVDALVAAMKDPDADVRWEAANALGEIKDPRAVPPLLEALQAKDLQWHAAYALGKIKDPRAVEPLIAALQNKDAEFREQVASALGEIKDPRADAALIAALKDPEPKVLHAAANALGLINDPQAVNILLTALREHNVEVIAGADNFFIRRGEPGSEDALIDALNKTGDHYMAADFLNSGNHKLSEAANQWASSHNYEITYMPGSKSTGWGDKQ
jgi:HEAT repeat protein